MYLVIRVKAVASCDTKRPLFRTQEHVQLKQTPQAAYEF